MHTMDERPQYSTDAETSPPPQPGVPQQPHRKVRKGTRSCWACKRRKVRCSFTSVQSQVCTHCQRRGSRCISQHVVEKLASADGSDSEPMLAVESLANNQPGRTHSRNSGSISTLTSNLLTPGDSSSTPYTTPSVVISSSIDRILEDRDTSLAPPYGPLIVDRKDLRDVSRALLSIYPPRHILKSLLERLQQDRLYMVLRNVRPANVLLQETATAWDFLDSDLQHPSIDTHPVLIAHQMLLIVVMLQRIYTSTDPNSPSAPRDQSHLTERFFDAVVNLVTTNEALHGTVECLECLMMEGLHLADLGRLKESWRANRRAILAAQQMGLHRTGANTRRFKRLDPRTPVYRESLWFRMLYYDRSFCLMLGLPQGSSDDNTPRDSTNLDPLERLDRAHTSIAGRMLECRDGRAMTDAESCALTRELDDELLQAARAVPLKFWQLAVSTGESHESRNTFLKIWRSTSQVFHFNLINQLHLPYLLRFNRDTQSENSKLACMAANREVLARYLAYRTSVDLEISCLTFDLLSLMAAITLLLAHLHDRLWGAAGGVLEHQRLCDLATIEQVLDTMKIVFQTSNNAISKSSINILRCLLHIEGDAAQGGRYMALCLRQPGSSPHDDEDDHADEPWEHNVVLRICMPYFGLVVIARANPVAPAPAAIDSQSSSALQQQMPPALIDGQSAPQPLAMGAYASPAWDDLPLQQYWNPDIILGADDWDFQGLNLDLFNTK